MGQLSTDRLESMINTLLQPTSANGVHGRSGLFERVVEALSVSITRVREPGTEVMNFPPVMSRGLLEKSGYLKSFPHLLGSVCCLHGEEGDIRALVQRSGDSGDWVAGLAPTDLVLTPAACYPVYPMVAARGDVPAHGVLFDVSSYCFRREVTYEVGRMQAFRMREYVCIGSPQAAVAFRTRWIERAGEMMKALALPHTVAPASDPFFGRLGKLMAITQVEQALKFELLIPVISKEQPTACMSFNYHQDHFGTTWNMRTATGELAHTACVAFGLDRLGVALFATHGLDVESWPSRVRETLSL
jgi:seryl-tRNA synthetase